MLENNQISKITDTVKLKVTTENNLFISDTHKKKTGCCMSSPVFAVMQLFIIWGRSE